MIKAVRLPGENRHVENVAVDGNRQVKSIELLMDLSAIWLLN